MRRKPSCLCTKPGATKKTAQGCATNWATKKPEEMLADLESAYAAAAADINAAGIIPCGEVFGELSKEGMKVHRDTNHANLGLGRYALALTWYKKLTGKDIIGNSFCDFDETVDPETALKVQKIVDGTLNK